MTHKMSYLVPVVRDNIRIGMHTLYVPPAIQKYYAENDRIKMDAAHDQWSKYVVIVSFRDRGAIIFCDCLMPSGKVEIIGEKALFLPGTE